KILDGTLPSDIPLQENKRGKLILNLKIAEKLDIVFLPSLLKNAEIIE
ncbi:MAG: ABC transporter substrate-binding protein, partial [Candidatus Cloacimonetes bacterium]|nr:ABC transporter substrate-binding protein [Candidatus Cloacimonadota bacterium]